MKLTKLSLLILPFILFVGCSEEKQIGLSESAADTKYVEYIFCDIGPDYSQEGFEQMIKEWNELQDSLETPVEISVGAVPRVENDLFDFLWAIAWDSEEVRSKAWSEWLEGPGSDWTEQVAPIVSCGASDDGVEGVYAFNAYLPWINQVTDPTPDQGVASYNFCSYTDDFKEANLVKQGAEIGGFIDSLNNDYGANSAYWLAFLVPTFETPIEGSSTGKYDYAVRGYWDNEGVRLESVAFMQTLPPPSGPQPACTGNEDVFDIYNFRNTDS
ncbi:MAG: hypothetical protein ACJ0F4_03215 [Gammaproteobacteria bacterium]